MKNAVSARVENAAGMLAAGPKSRSETAAASPMFLKEPRSVYDMVLLLLWPVARAAPYIISPMRKVRARDISATIAVPCQSAA